jgi:hypothetical protein
MDGGSSTPCDSLCDPVVLENWQAVEQLIKQTTASDSKQFISWITVHLSSDMLKVVFY